jgi:hypothetical protein
MPVYGIYLVAQEGAIDQPGAKFRPGWVRSYDPDAYWGRGHIEMTTDPRQAKMYADAKEATADWRTVSHVRPVRPDGKPNRPLTAFTVEIRPLPRGTL